MMKNVERYRAWSRVRRFDVRVIVVAFSAIAALGGCAADVGEEGSEGDEVDMPPLGPVPDRAEWEAGRAARGQGEGEGEKNCLNVRNDVISEITVHNGSWGPFASCMDLCPANSFALGINMKSESPRPWPGDDTSVNSISLHCFDRFTRQFTEFVESNQGPWGTWLGNQTCPSFSPIVSGNLRVESPVGPDDDTAANGIAIACSNNPTFQVEAPSNTSWGSFRGQRLCPLGTAVCGIRTRIEGSQGAGDDTALNGVHFACCRFP